MINKTKYKLPSSSAYNEWLPVRAASAVMPYQWLPAGAGEARAKASMIL